MNHRVIIGVAVTVAVVVGLFIALDTPTQDTSGAEKVASDSSAAQSNAQTSAATGDATAPSESVAEEPQFAYDHFRVGTRNIKSMLADGNIIWVGTSGGVIKYDITKDDYELYDNQSGLLSNGVFHLSKVDGELWVGTYGGGLSVLNLETQKWRNYNVPNGMGDSFVYDAIKTSNGDVWIATWSGANRIPGGNLDDSHSWELFTVENTNGGLPNDWVYGLVEGEDGEIWFATEGGLAHFKDDKWENWNHARGLGAAYDMVKSEIDFGSDPGDTSSHHAVQKQEQGLEDVNIAYNPNYVIALVYGQDDRVWVGTWGAGLGMFNGKDWRTFTTHDGLPSNHIFMIYEDDDGALWIGTNKGLSIYDGKTFKNYNISHGIFSDAVFSMAVAPDNTTWIGSYGGVARFYESLKAEDPK